MKRQQSKQHAKSVCEAYRGASEAYRGAHMQKTGTSIREGCLHAKEGSLVPKISDSVRDRGEFEAKNDPSDGHRGPTCMRGAHMNLIGVYPREKWCLGVQLVAN